MTTANRSLSRWTWAILPALLLSILAGAWSAAYAQDSTPDSEEVVVGVLDTAPVYIACDENVTCIWAFSS